MATNFEGGCTMVNLADMTKEQVEELLVEMNKRLKGSFIIICMVEGSFLLCRLNF